VGEGLRPYLVVVLTLQKTGEFDYFRIDVFSIFLGCLRLFLCAINYSCNQNRYK